MNDYNKAIACIIPLIIKNNAAAIAHEIRKAGYQTKKNIIPEAELEAKCFQLYITDPKKFFAVMQNVSWNNGHKETNTDEYKKIITIINAPQGIHWWNHLVNLAKEEYFK